MAPTTFLVLINARSGGQDGPHLLEKIRGVLADRETSGEVVSLTEPAEDGEGVIGPLPSLLKYSSRPDLRIIVCGGDGTVGWVLTAMDRVEWSGDRPPLAIIPLGTGNDLSRSLYWGGRYKDKPLSKYLHDVAQAGVERLDRWRLTVEPAAGGSVEKHPRGRDTIPAQNTVFNNYFSLGIDAHIALQFHNARNENQEKFTSRTRNLLFYGLEGGKDIFLHRWRHLMEYVTLRVVLADGTDLDLTKQLKDYGAHAILFLNIKYYSGGTRPWKQRPNFCASPHDSLIEVIALDNIDLALLHLGGTGLYMCQARRVELQTSLAVPMQVDGEPMLVNPCTISLALHNTVNMLTKKKTNYPYKDPEVEEWAARKIQNSFKEYKNQKSVTSLTKPSEVS